MSTTHKHKVGDCLTYTDRDYEDNIIFQGEGKLIFIDKDDDVCRNLVLFKINEFEAKDNCYIDSNMHQVDSGLLSHMKGDEFNHFISSYVDDEDNRVYWCADEDLTLGPPAYRLKDLLIQLENETKA